MTTDWPTIRAALPLDDDDRLFFTVGTAAVLEVVFWSLNIGLFLLHRYDLFGQYRLQPLDSYPDWDAIKDCLAEVVPSNLVVRPILLYLTYPLVVASGVGVGAAAPLPSAATVLSQIAVCVAVDDTIFYWAHRAMHTKLLYKHIHKQHHKFHHPIGIATSYAHPAEDLFCNSFATVAGPLLLGCHVTVFWGYLALKLWQSIDAHSGYNLPFPVSPFSALRTMDCAPAHDFHHSHNTGNFGGFFVFWDWVCGTNESYKGYLAKQKDNLAYQNVLSACDLKED